MPRVYGQVGCVIDGCFRRHHAKGFCGPHHHRWLRHGDPLAGGTRVNGPILDRISARIDIDPATECWVWTGAVGGNNNYGQIGYQGRTRHVHIVTYELLVGPVPEGLVLDHMCERPLCCNPQHLEPVTQAENLRRAREGRN